MCGLLGQFSTHLNHEKLQQALDSIAHRGPDAEGTWHNTANTMWLGHRRLSIVDLSDAGRQPMHNEDQTLWLICNGEIYNYPALRKQLEQEGHHFYSNSDSEVILHAYEKWGVACVEYLNGMFAFALWDDTQQQLFVARDRVGIKPLYYTTNHGFAFASEIKALLELMETTPPIYPMGIAYVMAQGYIPSPYTMWEDIHKLKPGCFLTYSDADGIQIKQYWSPPTNINFDDQRADWDSLFDQIVKEHLLADTPIGLFLSGGLDSSSIAYSFTKSANNIKAVTVGYDNARSEAPIAAEVCRALELEQQIIYLEVDDVDSLLKQVVNTYDDPQAYSALLSMYAVSELGASDYKVILSGDGGDEVLGGYNWYKTPNVSWDIRLKQLVKGIIPKTGFEQSVANFTKKSPLHDHAWRVYPRFLPDEIEALLQPFDLRFSADEMLAPLEEYYDQTLPLQRALQRVDLMTFCSDSILAKVDRASMAHSLEIRVPFLDHRLIEWGLSLPIHPQENNYSKLILTDYLKDAVPDTVLNHPKQGFSLSILHNFDWNNALTTISNGKLVTEGYLASNWQEFLSLESRYQTGRIWNLYVLTKWGDKWL